MRLWLYLCDTCGAKPKSVVQVALEIFSLLLFLAKSTVNNFFAKVAVCAQKSSITKNHIMQVYGFSVEMKLQSTLNLICTLVGTSFGVVVIGQSRACQQGPTPCNKGQLVTALHYTTVIFPIPTKWEELNISGCLLWVRLFRRESAQFLPMQYLLNKGQGAVCNHSETGTQV